MLLELVEMKEADLVIIKKMENASFDINLFSDRNTN